MDLKTATSVAFVFLAVAVFQGEALKCHVCTSYEHTKCNDPFHFDELDESGNEVLKTEEFLQECPQNNTLCRKIYQKVRGKERVIRSCGWIEYKYPCYKTVLEEYNTYVCACDTDGCNGGSALSASFVSVVLFALGGTYLVNK